MVCHVFFQEYSLDQALRQTEDLPIGLCVSCFSHFQVTRLFLEEAYLLPAHDIICSREIPLLSVYQEHSTFLIDPFTHAIVVSLWAVSLSKYDVLEEQHIL